ncbi:MAG TPA: TVP38/TMEM64 family protein [Cyanobacteria bacterium UBA8543]|nr:TVP38/TMEM64 family protein [Cyanobacteria bacterium UBA8543]
MLVPEIANLTIPRYPKKTLTNTHARNSKKRLRRVFLTLFVAGFALAISAAPVLAQKSANGGGFNPQEWLRNALQWIDSLGAVGAMSGDKLLRIYAFIAIYILATVAFIPGSILTFGSGVLFGVVWGSLYVFISATLGATIAFLVGRYLARGWVAKKIEGNHKFRAIDQAVGKEGLKIVLLTRLSPIFPFNLLNYAFGITGVSLQDYVIGSVGMIPGTVMYVYMGSLASNLATIGTASQPTNPGVQWAIRIIGFIATVAVTLYVTKVARKALEEEVLEPEDNQTEPINLN